MTVAELIERLKTFDQTVRVVVPGYESDVDDVESIHEIYIQAGYWGREEYWAGEHRVVWPKLDDSISEEDSEVAILVQGRHGDLP